LMDYSSQYNGGGGAGGGDGGDEFEGASVKSSDSRESNRSGNSWTSMGSFASKNSMRSGYTTGSRRINKGGANGNGTTSSIRSSSRGRSTTGIRGPPVRMQSGGGGGGTTRSSSVTRRNGGMTRQDTLKSSNSSFSSANRNRIPTGNGTTPKKSPTRSRIESAAAAKYAEEEAATKIQALERDASSGSVSPEPLKKETSSELEEPTNSPNMNDARLQSSTLLKERSQSADSSTGGSPQANGHNGGGGGSGGSTASSENVIIANQLLAAHKTYIDELMENLRKEMNCVREFESKLAKASSSTSSMKVEDTGENSSQLSSTVASTTVVTEDAVMDYFEKVYGFLEKANENGKNLRKAIEKVSRAEGQ